MKRVFDSFQEAARYANQFCIDNKTTARLENINDRWAVVPSDEYLEIEARQAEDRKLAEARRTAYRRAEADAAKRADINRKRLEQRHIYFKTLPKDALQALWDNRDQPLSGDEIAIVRDLLREKLGINKPIDRGPHIQYKCNACGSTSPNLCRCSE